MEVWIVLTAASIAAYTVFAFVLKFAAERVRSEKVITIAVAVVTILAAILATVRGEWGGTWGGALVAIAAGVIFFAASIYRAKALETAQVSMVFAITNLDLVVSGAITLLIPLFGVTFNLWRGAAIVAAGAAILVGQRLRGVQKMPKEVFLSLGLLSISAMGYIIYARFFTPLLFFIVLDHLAGLVLNAKNLENTTRSEVLWGAAAGLCMFLGFWSLMEALAISGENLPLVLLALSMKTPLTALLAVPIAKEKFDLPKLSAVLLASLALILWEIGG